MHATATGESHAVNGTERVSDTNASRHSPAKGASCVSLVTGAAGFIGSHVAAELAQMGHRVVALDDLSGGFVENIPEGARFVKGSVNDAELITHLFEEYEFDYVFHLAAYASEGLSHFVRGFNYTNNLLGSVNLINAAVNAGTVQCFVFASSIAVYGRSTPPMTEEAAPRPIDPYGVAKLAVELDLAAAREVFGLNSIIFRPHNVYGQNQHAGDQYRNVIGIFMKQILEGRPLTIFGDGSQKRAFTHVSDVAPVLARSVTRQNAYNEIFNIGCDEPTAILELARRVSAAMGVPLRVEHLPARVEAQEAYCSHEKVRAVFGDLIRDVPLEEGLAQMAQWLKQKGWQTGAPFRQVEIAKQMPACWARAV